MTIAIVGPAGAGATAVAPALQPPAPSTTAAATAEDKVTLSAAAQEVPQPMSMQVLALHNQGQSVAQIATQLAISPSSVQSYLGTPPPTAKLLTKFRCWKRTGKRPPVCVWSNKKCRSLGGMNAEDDFRSMENSSTGSAAALHKSCVCRGLVGCLFARFPVSLTIF